MFRRTVRFPARVVLRCAFREFFPVPKDGLEALDVSEEQSAFAILGPFGHVECPPQPNGPGLEQGFATVGQPDGFPSLYGEEFRGLRWRSGRLPFVFA
ncbi:MAG: hypothetical protein N2322_03595 [Terrimicrobiaceae bacterium]|nr:hypothetical protein [Terrimicrobiaceae bacterium]